MTLIRLNIFLAGVLCDTRDMAASAVARSARVRHRLKPSRNPNSHEASITARLDAKEPSAYVRSKRGAMNPHTARIMIAPTIAPKFK
jgi:hypothetical protein